MNEQYFQNMLTDHICEELSITAWSDWRGITAGMLAYWQYIPLHLLMAHLNANTEAARWAGGDATMAAPLLSPTAAKILTQAVRGNIGNIGQ